MECSELRHQVLNSEGVLDQAWPSAGSRNENLSRPDESDAEVKNFKVILDGAEASPPDKAYWVTASRAGFRRLHRLGGCGTYQASKPDYDQFDDLIGVTVDARCRHCWPSYEAEVSSDDTSSSDSSLG